MLELGDDSSGSNRVLKGLYTIIEESIGGMSAGTTIKDLIGSSTGGATKDSIWGNSGGCTTDDSICTCCFCTTDNSICWKFDQRLNLK